MRFMTRYFSNSGSSYDDEPVIFRSIRVGHWSADEPKTIELETLHTNQMSGKTKSGQFSTP